MDLVRFSALLQACVSPMLLVSGVGLILLTVGNRLSHTIDRIRLLDVELEAAGPHREAKLGQLRLLFSRARVLQASIACVGCSILSSALIVLSLFGAAFQGVSSQSLATGLFAASLLFMIASVVLLLVDVSRALSALRLEIREHLR